MLSNFYSHDIKVFGMMQQSSEHAFQYTKAINCGHPEEAEKFLAQSQTEVMNRYHYYEQLASLEWDAKGDLEPPHRKLKAEVTSTKEQAS